MGMLDSAKMIIGDVENVVALSLEPGDSIDEYVSRLDEITNIFPAGFFILVDIKCGTPFNSLLRVVNDKKLYGVAGANLPLLLEMVLMRDNNTLEEMSNASNEVMKQSICNLREFQNNLLSEV